MNKVKEFIREHKDIILIFSGGIGLICVIPVIMNWIMSNFNFGIGSNGDWLGFWGGYLGSIIAILGVYWQTTRQALIDKKNITQNFKNEERILKEQLSFEVNKSDKAMRPNFVMEISVKDFDGKEVYVNDYDAKRTTKFLKKINSGKINAEQEIIEITNYGDLPITNLSLLIIYNSDEQEIEEHVTLPIILPHSNIDYLPRNLINTNLPKIRLVWMNLTTLAGEQVRYELIKLSGTDICDILGVYGSVDEKENSVTESMLEWFSEHNSIERVRKTRIDIHRDLTIL